MQVYGIVALIVGFFAIGGSNGILNFFHKK